MISEIRPKIEYGYLAIAITIIGWGIAPTIVEIGLKSIDPMNFFMYRFLFAVIILSPFILYTRINSIVLLLKNKWTLIVAFSQVVGLLLQYISQKYMAAALSAVITFSFSYAFLVPFLAILLLKDKFVKKHLVYASISFIGVFLIATNGFEKNLNAELIGIILALLASVGFGFYIVSTSRLTTKEFENVDSLALLYIVMVINTIGGLITGIITVGSIPILQMDTLFYTLVLSIFSTIIAYVFYFEALKKIPANKAAVLLILQSVITFFFDFILFSRIVGQWQILGSVLIIVSAYLVLKIPSRVH